MWPFLKVRCVTDEDGLAVTQMLENCEQFEVSHVNVYFNESAAQFWTKMAVLKSPSLKEIHICCFSLNFSHAGTHVTYVWHKIKIWADCEFIILPLDMLDPVLLKLPTLLVKESDRVIRLLLHEVRHLHLQRSSTNQSSQFSDWLKESGPINDCDF